MNFCNNCLLILFFVNLLLFVVLCDNSTDHSEVKRRPKRYLAFIQKSKYFMRLNTKHNMVPEFRIFAQATGFRINFDTPYYPGYKFRKLSFGGVKKKSKRDLYQNLEQLILQQGYEGRTCIQKAICEASRIAENRTGILIKLFKKIFTFNEEEKDGYLNLDQCDQIDGFCPLSIAHLSRFTDD